MVRGGQEGQSGYHVHEAGGLMPEASWGGHIDLLGTSTLVKTRRINPDVVF